MRLLPVAVPVALDVVFFLLVAGGHDDGEFSEDSLSDRVFMYGKTGWQPIRADLK